MQDGLNSLEVPYDIAVMACMLMMMLCDMVLQRGNGGYCNCHWSKHILWKDRHAASGCSPFHLSLTHSLTHSFHLLTIHVYKQATNERSNFQQMLLSIIFILVVISLVLSAGTFYYLTTITDVESALSFVVSKTNEATVCIFYHHLLMSGCCRA